MEQPAGTGKIDIFSPSVRREWLYDGQIVYHTVSNSTRTSVDIAREMFEDSMRNWPLERPYLAVNDYSHPDVSMSPYAQKMLKEIRQFRPELKGYIAVVMGKGFISQIIRLFVRNTPGLRVNELFFARDNAVTWLVGRMNSQPQPPKPEE